MKNSDFQRARGCSLIEAKLSMKYRDSKEHEHTQRNLISHLDKFQRVWRKDAQIGQNPLFWETFWYFLKFSMEEKGPKITNLEIFS